MELSLCRFITALRVQLCGDVEPAVQAAAAAGIEPKEDKEEEVASTSDREENGVGESSERTCTGILTSHPQSRDIQIEKFTLLFHGHALLEDTDLELNYGR